MGEERIRPTQHALDDDDDLEGDTGDESKLLSRYGVWLMVELCKPRDGIPVVSCSCSHQCFESQMHVIYEYVINKRSISYLLYMYSVLYLYLSCGTYSLFVVKLSFASVALMACDVKYK